MQNAGRYFLNEWKYTSCSSMHERDEEKSNISRREDNKQEFAAKREFLVPLKEHWMWVSLNFSASITSTHYGF